MRRQERHHHGGGGGGREEERGRRDDDMREDRRDMRSDRGDRDNNNRDKDRRRGDRLGNEKSNKRDGDGDEKDENMETVKKKNLHFVVKILLSLSIIFFNVLHQIRLTNFNFFFLFDEFFFLFQLIQNFNTIG